KATVKDASSISSRKYARRPRKRRGLGLGDPPLVSGPRVVLAEDLAQALSRQVRVDLGGADVRVTEHRLHRAQIGAVLEEVGGEGVTELVRGDAAAALDRQA